MVRTPLIQASYIFDPRPTYPLRTTVKRYWHPDSPSLHDPEALTLVFAHGLSFHKEIWEPCLSDLQVLIGRGAPGAVRIREVWAIDCPNHGDAAALNEAVLHPGYEATFPWEEYARTLHLFLSGLGTGVDVDFSCHTLVGIGHSMGAISLALSRGYYPPVRFAAFIAVELMAMPHNFGAETTERLSGAALRRRDCWPSKVEAYRMMKARGAWASWDDRALRTYVAHGLRPFPTKEYPDGVGVTLKCTRVQEAASYRDPLGIARGYESVSEMVRSVPTHLIYGGIEDYLPAEIKRDVIENQAGGLKNFASYATVEGAGHLVVQCNPKGLAEKIYNALVLMDMPKHMEWAKM